MNLKTNWPLIGRIGRLKAFEWPPGMPALDQEINMFEGPDKKFQRHIADFLIKEHSYTVLEQDDMIDPEYYFVEDHFISFVRVTQKENFKTHEKNYGSDASDEK